MTTTSLYQPPPPSTYTMAFGLTIGTERATALQVSLSIRVKSSLADFYC